MTAEAAPAFSLHITTSFQILSLRLGFPVQVHQETKSNTSRQRSVQEERVCLRCQNRRRQERNAESVQTVCAKAIRLWVYFIRINIFTLIKLCKCATEAVSSSQLKATSAKSSCSISRVEPECTKQTLHRLEEQAPSCACGVSHLELWHSSTSEL